MHRHLSLAVLKTPVLLLSALAACAGCQVDGPDRDLRQRIEAAARPILELDCQAVWTDCYNELVDRLPASLQFLADHPRLAAPASRDDLRVMVHLSLLRLLIHPAQRPRLTATCLETTLDLLHFDLSAQGRRLGSVLMPCGQPVRAWHELFPTDIDLRRAAAVDVEADRQAMIDWWRENRHHLAAVVETRRLCPRAEHLWGLLGRRQADRWTYEPPRVLRCRRQPALFCAETCDYNLVRAACAWLGSRPDPAVRDRLIELIASPSPIVSYNACLALRYSPDERIRDLLEKYQDREVPAAPTVLPAELTHGAQVFGSLACRRWASELWGK